MTRSAATYEPKNTSPKTPATQLRELLSDIETRLGRLGITGKEDAIDIPALIDQAEAALADLQPTGIDISSELARFETLTAQYRSKATKFLRIIGGPSALRQAREAHRPPTEAWWWFIDEYLEQQRREALRRTGKSLLIAAGVFAIIAVLYIIFLQPDKATRDRLRYQSAAEQLLSQGNFEDALEQTERALEVAPENGELWALKGAIQESLGEERAASISFEKALSIFGNLPDFLSARIQAYLNAQRFEAALADAEQLVALQPESAQAYLQLASALIGVNRLAEAYTSYETAASLASRANQVELEGIARVQMANLLLQLSSPAMPTATP